MKVFLALPFSQFCENDKDEVEDCNKWFFKDLTKKVKELGLEYFLAHEREDWGAKYKSAEESTLIDFNAMKTSDLVVAVPGNPISGGVHIELGWASTMNKKILMFLDKDKEYSPMIEGLNSVTDVKYFFYQELISIELINEIISAIKEELCIKN